MRPSFSRRSQRSHVSPYTLPFIFTVFILSFFTRPVLSDVSISLPLTGQTYSASSGTAKIPITWIESNAAPKLSDITSYKFILCTGPNTDIHALDDGTTVDASDLDGYSYTAEVDASEGADGQYYFQIYALAKTGWSNHYTNRFKLTDMTGDYEPTVGSVTTPPSGETSLSDGTNTGVASVNSKSFSIYYTSQTGLTRYAPMQTQPGSTVTKKNTAWSRRYPTSAVTYYTSLSTHLDQLSTITPGWSYTVSSAVNWASPAPFPSENGGWYAASEKLSRTPVLYTPTVISGHLTTIFDTSASEATSTDSDDTTTA